MPVTLMQVGQSYTIKRIGGTDKTKSHLENLGFVSGAKITIVSADGGDMILNVKDARVAINKELANRIFV